MTILVHRLPGGQREWAERLIAEARERYRRRRFRLVDTADRPARVRDDWRRQQRERHEHDRAAHRMILATPPRPATSPSLADPEALIEEARARQRRRRLIGCALGFVVVAVGFGSFFAFVGGGGGAATLRSIGRGVAASVARSRGRILSVDRQPTTTRLRVRELSLVDLATGTQRTVLWMKGRVDSVARTTYTGPREDRIMHTLELSPSGRWWLSSDSYATQVVFTPAYLCDCDPFDYKLGALDRRVVLLRGDQIVDGQPTFHVRVTWITPAPSRARLAVDSWISRATLLPLRETLGTQTRIARTVEFRWLPRTPSELARLQVRVPPGFRRLGS